MAMIWVSFRKPSGNSGRIGPVDQAAGENFFFGGTSFALDEAAGNLPGGVGVFAVIDGEREEARARLWARRPYRR